MTSLSLFDERKIPPAGVPLTRGQIEAIKGREALLVEREEIIKGLEEQADALYIETIRQLYTVDAENAVRVEVWSRLFDRLEATCDACEEVADTMANIMLKNV